ncbi:MAG: hypothetical protein ISR78_08445, partial [Spirochaetia bacterium]|nr:hypothetical protein [Spirochaetia bacterium]
MDSQDAHKSPALPATKAGSLWYDIQVLDKSLPYYDIFMRRASGTAIPQTSAPEGISIRTYQDGDEEFWAAAETAVGEFSCEEDALARFSRDFSPWREELPLRCLFAVNPA